MYVAGHHLCYKCIHSIINAKMLCEFHMYVTFWRFEDNHKDFENANVEMRKFDAGYKILCIKLVLFYVVWHL